DEIEGRADPRDAGDDMQPANGEVQPVPGYRKIVHDALPSRSDSMAPQGRNVTRRDGSGQALPPARTFNEKFKMVRTDRVISEQCPDVRACRRARQSLRRRARPESPSGRGQPPEHGAGASA